MNLLFDAIHQHAIASGSPPALRGSELALTYAQLQSEIEIHSARWRSMFQHGNMPTVAMAIENHPAWVVLDLVAMRYNIPLVPLPFFFSPAQWLHAMQDAGASILITDQPALFNPILADHIIGRETFEVAGKLLTQLTLDFSQVALPARTAKITYTSGTTGNPKGVCLSIKNMLQVAQSIATATKLSTQDVHLSVLPLATLLENVAGVYACLLAGATCVLLPSNQVGLNGAAGLDIHQLLAALKQTKASTTIFTPELLHALVLTLEAGETAPQDLRFLAVGGASVSPALLQRAHAQHLPVFEGYGLSECASVVALNTPEANHIGSVGKVLPHLQATLDTDGEIIVQGNAYLGYVGQASVETNEVRTGDIGYIDETGNLYITGRKKNIFITSFGRNVSPEWVERELKISPYIAQAVLFGEAKPWNVAIIVPRKHVNLDEVAHSINTINSGLPDYARVTKWLIADEPFNIQNQQLTANGRNRRDIIWQHYQGRINALYEGTET